MSRNYQLDWETNIFGIPTNVVIRYEPVDDSYEIMSLTFWKFTLYSNGFPIEVIVKALEEVQIYEASSKVDHAMDLITGAKENGNYDPRNFGERLSNKDFK